MKKLIFGINITLDGCSDHTKGNANEEVHEYFTELTRKADVLLYGRKTYELMVPFWPDVAKNPSGMPKATADFAKAFDAVNQIVVVSTTLDNPEDGKTIIVRDNLSNEILQLKQGEGVILTGGVDLPTQLIGLGMVDELHVVIHPVIAGEGRRLFDHLSLPESHQLELVGSKIFQSGHVALRYVKT